MLEFPRWVLTLIGISFALFHVTLGLLSWTSYDNDNLLFLSVAIYLTTVVVSLTLKPGLAMGRFMGAVSFVGALSTAITANAGIGAGQTGTYASWYVGGLGLLLGIVAVRGEAFAAWLGAALVTILVIQVAGFAGIGTAGVVGMIVLVAAGQATARALQRADNEVKQIQQAEHEASLAIVATEVANEERKSRLGQILQRVVPALSYISASGGKLSETERQTARQLEATLRDEIRGRLLINELTSKAITDARRRGVQVLLLDEGGLDATGETEREQILSKVAAGLESVEEGKVTIRAPRGESWRVTVVATRSGQTKPDIFLKL